MRLPCRVIKWGGLYWAIKSGWKINPSWRQWLVMKLAACDCATRLMSVLSLLSWQTQPHFGAQGYQLSVEEIAGENSDFSKHWHWERK